MGRPKLGRNAELLRGCPDRSENRHRDGLLTVRTQRPAERNFRPNADGFEELTGGVQGFNVFRLLLRGNYILEIHRAGAAARQAGPMEQVVCGRIVEYRGGNRCIRFGVHVSV